MRVYNTRDDMIAELAENMVVAEIGVFEGEFSKKIIELCDVKFIYLVDTFNGIFGSGDKDGMNYHMCDLTEKHKELKELYKHDKRVKVVKQTSDKFFNYMSMDELDMVYIDADHSYASVMKDLENSVRVVRIDGFICGHDYVVGTDVYNAVNDFCRIYELEIDCITKDGCPSYCIINK